MKKIVVTGATSMLGVALIEEALANTETEVIFAVVRPETLRIDRLPKDTRIWIVRCEADQYSQLPEMIRDSCDVFFHFAWLATGEKRNQNSIAQCENIRYTVEALRVASKLGCQKFVASGSQAEYGNCDQSRIAPDSPVNPTQLYGVAKYAAGKFALQEAAQLGIDCFWVRVFSVFGKLDKPTTMVANTIKKLQNREHCAFTAAVQIWDYLYSKDAGRAFYLIGKEAEGRKVYCLGSGEGRPLYTFIEQMRDLISPEAELGFGEVPYPQGKPLSICADVSDLWEDIKWKPEWSFEAGLRDMLGDEVRDEKP